MRGRLGSIYTIVVVMLLAVIIGGCSRTEEEAQVDFFAMDTYMSLTASGENAQEAIDESEQFIYELEGIISRTEETSEIYALNHSDGEVVIVSDMTYDIISIAVACAKETEGAFDPTICAVTDLWGIGTENPRVPSQSAIDEALETVSYENIVLLEGNGVQLLNRAQIDLGGIGKGYAADAVRAIYESYEIETGMIVLGGNVYMVGEKEEGTSWNVGIVDPDQTDEYNIGVQVVDKSVVTTGAYERYFEEDGVIYHHLFDTSTGYPTEEDIKSVTIVSENSTLADVYATALFVMGYEEAIAFAENIEEINVIIIRDTNEVYVSEALQGSVTLDGKYSLEW